MRQLELLYMRRRARIVCVGASAQCERTMTAVADLTIVDDAERLEHRVLAELLATAWATNRRVVIATERNLLPQVRRSGLRAVQLVLRPMRRAEEVE